MGRRRRSPQSILATLSTGVIGEETAPVRPAGEIRPPRLIRRVPPVYPEIARQARVEGVVEVECVTDITGRVTGVRLVRSIPLLDQAAIDAVRQWFMNPWSSTAGPAVWSST